MLIEICVICKTAMETMFVNYTRHMIHNSMSLLAETMKNKMTGSGMMAQACFFKDLSHFTKAPRSQNLDLFYDIRGTSSKFRAHLKWKWLLKHAFYNCYDYFTYRINENAQERNTFTLTCRVIITLVNSHQSYRVHPQTDSKKA